MRFSVEEERQIKQWTSKLLQSIKQNNYEEVAKYVMSVLKREDKDKESLKTFCFDDFRQFLKDKTAYFVDKLFSALQDGSYKVGVDNDSDEDNKSADGADRRSSHDDVDNEYDYVDYVEEEDDSRGRRRMSSEDNNEYSPEMPYKHFSHAPSNSLTNHSDTMAPIIKSMAPSSAVLPLLTNPTPLQYPYQQYPPQQQIAPQWPQTNAAHHHHAQSGVVSNPAYPSVPYHAYPVVPPVQGLLPPSYEVELHSQQQLQYPAPLRPPPPPRPAQVAVPTAASEQLPVEYAQTVSSSSDGYGFNLSSASDAPTSPPFSHLPYGAQVPPYQPQYQPQYQYGQAMHQQPYNFSKPHGSVRGHSRHGEHVTPLPESERFTLKCSGIPSYFKEEDIRAHFAAFGHIVELQVTPTADSRQQQQPSGEEESVSFSEKKSFNEALIQFLSVANAKKCFNSPASVLNNRFIKLVQSHFNIIPPSDVELLPDEVYEADRQLLSKDGTKGFSSAAAASATKKKPHSGLNMYSDGPSNKYRRVSDPVMSTPVKGADTEQGEYTPSGAQTPVEAGLSSPAGATPSKEDTEMKARFDELRTLRSKQEDIWKQKEAVLQAQVDKCRQMVEKLDASEDSDSKQKLLDNLESKIVDLQSQLRTVRQQLESGFHSESPAPHTQAVPSSFHPHNAGGGYRGRGGGRYTSHGYVGRGYAARGNSGRGGGGRGRSSTTYFRDVSAESGNGHSSSAEQSHEDQSEHHVENSHSY